MSNMRWNDSLIQACEQRTGLPISRDVSILNAVNTDFGRLVDGLSVGTLSVKSSSQLQSVLAFAHDAQVPITIQNKALSQSGQALGVAGSLVVKVNEINSIYAVDEHTIQVGCGATWADIMEFCQDKATIPYVYPFRLDISIGGTLAAGGIGASSHRYGLAASHVASLEVITAAGEQVSCDPQMPLFAASLATQGYLSVIANANIKLRASKPMVRTFHLLYHDYDAWSRDQKIASTQLRADYLESFNTAALLGTRSTANGRRPFAKWLYPMQVSFEYDIDAPSEKMLNAFNGAQLMHIEDMTLTDYVNRYQVRFDMMERSGAWNLYHPWFECIIERRQLERVLSLWQAKVPLSLGGYHHVFPIEKHNFPYFFMHPDASDLIVLTLLPTGVADYELESIMSALEDMNALLLNAGAKRYLSGWLGEMNAATWQNHYAEKLDYLQSLKNIYDPNHILTSRLFETMPVAEKAVPQSVA